MNSPPDKPGRGTNGSTPAPPGRPGTFRDEPTAASETRTVKWDKAPPWLAGTDPEPRPSRPHDRFFWPVVVFVVALGLTIGFMAVTGRLH